MNSESDLSRPRAKASQSLLGSLAAATAGLLGALRTQRNLRIQVVTGGVVVFAGWWLQLERWEWGLIVLAIGLVLVLELVNTALEAVVDLASPQWHMLAKQAKDTAAGAVLLTACMAVLLGLIVFSPHLMQWWWPT